MPVENNPVDPNSGTSSTVTPIKQPLKAVSATDLNSIITQIQAAMPSMRFFYLSWKEYMTVEQKVLSTVYLDADKIIMPILQKDPTTLTADDTAMFLGAAIAVCEQGAKDLFTQLTPLLGADVLNVLTVLGLV